MESPKPKSKREQRNVLILLATTTLAASNLMVGLMQNNRFLIAASAILAAAFATVYVLRNRLLGEIGTNQQPKSEEAVGYGPKLSIWVFPAIIFLMFPAVLLLMRWVQGAGGNSI